MERGLGWWLMQDKETGETIGNVLLQPFGNQEVEIGLQIVHRHWTHGFGTEAAAATLAYGFDSLKIRRIVAVTHPQNQATKRILEKLEFQQDGFVMHKGFPHERYFKDREPSSEPAP
jgi:ribosomal-protein-alanine N-acetyltransferase